MSSPVHPPSQSEPKNFVCQVETYAREEPLKAASAAFGAGILMALLPIGGILSLLGRIFFLLARPILMILGVVKLVEHFDSRRPPTDSR